MSNAASGANVTHLFNPDDDTHYAISEEADYELRDLFDALTTLGHVMDTPPGEAGAEIEPAHLAPVLRSFARHGKRILDTCPVRFPKPQRKSA